jgi:signal transduction histidine kinase
MTTRRSGRPAPRATDRAANEADPRSRAGLGVGLALVRNLVELHGGSVSAASAGTGRGSEFTVRRPTEG